jgi:hypothetical protein
MRVEVGEVAEFRAGDGLGPRGLPRGPGTGDPADVPRVVVVLARARLGAARRTSGRRLGLTTE